MSATAHAESDSESRVRVTFCDEVVELHPEEAQEEDDKEDPQLVDCFGPDGTAICAVCLGRCSKDATLCAGESALSPTSMVATTSADGATADATAATTGATAGVADSDAADSDAAAVDSRQPDVEQGALLPVESECQDAALMQTALRLQCNHVFHVDCLSLWMNRAAHPTCPTCRAAVAPAQLTHMEASSPELRQLIDRTVTPPPRSVRWSLPTLPGRRPGARRQGPAATTLGSRWQCRLFVHNLALHLGYPMALFGGVGGLLYLWSES